MASATNVEWVPSATCPAPHPRRCSDGSGRSWPSDASSPSPGAGRRCRCGRGSPRGSNSGNSRTRHGRSAIAVARHRAVLLPPLAQGRGGSPPTTNADCIGRSPWAGRHPRAVLVEGVGIEHVDVGHAGLGERVVRVGAAVVQVDGAARREPVLVAVVVEVRSRSRSSRGSRRSAAGRGSAGSARRWRPRTVRRRRARPRRGRRGVGPSAGGERPRRPGGREHEAGVLVGQLPPDRTLQPLVAGAGVVAKAAPSAVVSSMSWRRPSSASRRRRISRSRCSPASTRVEGLGLHPLAAARRSGSSAPHPQWPRTAALPRESPRSLGPSDRSRAVSDVTERRRAVVGDGSGEAAPVVRRYANAYYFSGHAVEAGEGELHHDPLVLHHGPPVHVPVGVVLAAAAPGRGRPVPRRWRRPRRRPAG